MRSNHKNKNVALLLIVLLVGNICYAATDDFYLCRAIKHINNHSFGFAEQEFYLVQDWYYKDSASCADTLNIENALEFVGYAHAQKIDGEKILKYGCYIISECSHLGKKAFLQKNYEDALVYFDLSLSLMQPIVGENNKDYALISILMGYIYEEKEDYDNAETYYLRGTTILKQLSLEQCLDYAKALEHLGIINYEKGNYSIAETYLLQSAEIIKTTFSDRILDCCEIMGHLCVVHYKMDNIVRAKEFFLNFFRGFKTLVEKNSVDIAIDMDIIESIFDAAIGYSKLDESLIASIMPMIQKADEYELCLAQLYQGIGDLSKAEYYYLQALQKNVNKYGEDNKNQAPILNGLASVYSAIGDTERALKNYDKALHIYKKYYGDENLDVANSMDNIGTILMDKEEYESARYYLEEALRVKTIILGDFHSEVANTLRSLGNLYRIIGEEEKSEHSFLAAINIIKSTYGENSRKYVLLLNDIAILYKNQYEYAKAERYYKEALRIGKIVLGEDNSSYKTTEMNLSRLYYFLGIYDKAYKFFRQYLQKKKELFINSINFLSEKQREMYLETMSDAFEYFAPRLAFQYKSINSSLSNSLAYDNELFRKGILLSSSKSVNTSILESNDTTLIKKWHTLTTIKQNIIRSQDNEEQTENSTKLKEQAEQLEKEILRYSAAYRANVQFWNVTYENVRTSLKRKHVAIEFMKVPLKSDSIVYCALLLRDTCSYPIMTPLFEEKEVVSLINTSTENQTSFTYSYDGNGKQLSQLLWSKILPYIKKGETVYFAPSGLLHQLAIESLPYDENHTMADMFNLVRLSSTREIVTRKKDTQHSSATLYGGIQYDVDADELLAESEKYTASDLLASRGIESDTLDRGSIKYLKGTKTEVENINKLLKHNKVRAQLFTSTKANEESFKALSGKHHNILHIATHGFFWTDSTAQKKDYFSQRMLTLDNNMPTHPSIDPLNRCGLLFAGAQTAWSGHSTELPEGVQDGILTAKEISLLDLRDADLVVLSACETGKGEITGEGVFGLQRAFKQAGAQTIIMSLWPVNDAATQLLMTEFYRNWITNHQSKREAFRNAQNTVRSQMEAPYYWAGFIMLD